MFSPVVDVHRSTDAKWNVILDLVYKRDTREWAEKPIKSQIILAGYCIEPPAQHLIHNARNKLVANRRYRIGVMPGTTDSNTYPTYVETVEKARGLGWGEMLVMAALCLGTIPCGELGFDVLAVFHERVKQARESNPAQQSYYHLRFFSHGTVTATRADNGNRFRPCVACAFAIPC